ncbi:hypothetical protein EB796_023536 [Bugula neritina]|uniref:Uncharacterized protein n=1 Tax=Bugula neritina TaxID=10212 RepID=A0A7J7IX90_BUGNE|nr:hypothetical protein EB796_023536 [Bugula neritina]
MEEIRDIIRGVENFRRCGSPSLHDEMEQLVDRLPVEGNMTWTKIIMIMAIFLELAETDYHHGDMDRIEALIRTAEQVFELAEITVWITNNGEAEEELMRQLAVASTSRLRRYIDKEVRRLAKRQDQFGAECRRREQEEIAARMAEGQPLAAAQGEEDAAEEEPMHAPEHQEEVPSQPIPPTTPRSSTRQSTNPRSFNTGDAAQALLNLAGKLHNQPELQAKMSEELHHQETQSRSLNQLAKG